VAGPIQYRGARNVYLDAASRSIVSSNHTPQLDSVIYLGPKIVQHFRRRNALHVSGTVAHDDEGGLGQNPKAEDPAAQPHVRADEGREIGGESSMDGGHSSSPFVDCWNRQEWRKAAMPSSFRLDARAHRDGAHFVQCRCTDVPS
jgi:hypothetical protein